MPVNPVKMLKDVPGALHVQVKDAAGVLHDGVLTAVSETRGAGEYGFPQVESDTVYVAAPFVAPRATLTVLRDGRASVRKIEGVVDNAAFYEISLGGKIGE